MNLSSYKKFYDRRWNISVSPYISLYLFCRGQKTQPIEIEMSPLTGGEHTWFYHSCNVDYRGDSWKRKGMLSRQKKIRGWVTSTVRLWDLFRRSGRKTWKKPKILGVLARKEIAARSSDLLKILLVKGKKLALSRAKRIIDQAANIIPRSFEKWTPIKHNAALATL